MIEEGTDIKSEMFVRHKKSGRIYQVLARCQMKTGESSPDNAEPVGWIPGVVYSPATSDENEKTFVRDEAHFRQSFELADASDVS